MGETGVPKASAAPPTAPHLPTLRARAAEQTTIMATSTHSAPLPSTTWTRFCVLCANLTVPQQVSAWDVLFAGVVLPSMSPSAVADGSFLATAFRFSLFVVFSLAGYQGFTIVQHAQLQLAALEERHEMLTGKNLKLSERFKRSTRPQQEAQAFIFSSGRFLQSRYGLPRPVAEEFGQIVDLTIRDFIMQWFLIYLEPPGPGKAARWVRWVYGRVRSASNQPCSGTLAPRRWPLVRFARRAVPAHPLRWLLVVHLLVGRCCVT